MYSINNFIFLDRRIDTIYRATALFKLPEIMLLGEYRCMAWAACSTIFMD